MDFAQILQQCRENFGSAPRRFSWWSRKFTSSFYYPLPEWLEPEEGLVWLYQNLPVLFAHGYVTWGHIVQANYQLFEAGDANCPGELVYCTDPDNSVSPDRLSELAGSLAELKHQEPSHPQLREIADHLNAETTRAFALPVPVKSKSKFALSTTMFHRDHLPAGMITIPFMPIIASTNDSGVVITLPKAFWPRELSHWHQGTPLETIEQRPAKILYKRWLASLLSWDAPIALLVFLIPMLLSLLFPQGGGLMEIVGVVVPIVGVLARFYHGRKQIRQNFCSQGFRVFQQIALAAAALVICLLDAMLILMRGIEMSQGDAIVSAVMGLIYLSLAAVATYPGKGWE